jgi:hypothetical protein
VSAGLHCWLQAELLCLLHFMTEKAGHAAHQCWQRDSAHSKVGQCEPVAHQERTALQHLVHLHITRMPATACSLPASGLLAAQLRTRALGG